MPFLLGNSLHVYIIVGFFSRHLSTFRCVQHKLHHTQLLMNSIQEVNYLTVLLHNELNSILREHTHFFYKQAFSEDIFAIPSKNNRDDSKINVLCKCRSRKNNNVPSEMILLHYVLNSADFQHCSHFQQNQFFIFVQIYRYSFFQYFLSFCNFQ